MQTTKKDNKVLQLLGGDEVEKIENPKQRCCKAVMMLLLGSLLAAIFADPLVDHVDDFSNATNIPSFLVPFDVLPFATSSDTVSALVLPSPNKLRISLKFLLCLKAIKQRIMRKKITRKLCSHIYMHEQHVLSVSLPGPRLFSPFDMELHN